jgi:cobalamin biosynthesis Mg chelatase CobN
MCSRRRLGGALVASAAAMALFSTPAPAGAASLDACAQRVIRDWYSGGRIDNVYPLACYRAAIDALPSDVLAYSNADQDIRRALAFARQGRTDPGNGAEAAAKAAPTRTAAPTATAAAATTDADTARRTEPASPAAPAAEKRVAAPAPAGAQTAASASVPYPIIALAGLSALLLATGAIGWLANRRHRPGDAPDR